MKEKIKAAINYWRFELTALDKINIAFVIVFIGAWVANGVHNTKFNLDELMCFYGIMAGVKVTGHTVNSVFNSPRNVPPTNNTGNQGGQK